MIVGLIVALAAVANAIMDTVDQHFFESIFNDLTETDKARLWWCENQGWKNKYIDRDPAKGRVQWKIGKWSFNKLVQFCDAWHFFKMVMIILLCAGMALELEDYLHFHLFIYPIVLVTENTQTVLWLTTLAHFLWYGIIWNVTFNIFYDHILRRKN